MLWAYHISVNSWQMALTVQVDIDTLSLLLCYIGIRFKTNILYANNEISVKLINLYIIFLFVGHITETEICITILNKVTLLSTATISGYRAADSTQ